MKEIVNKTNFRPLFLFLVDSETVLESEAVTRKQANRATYLDKNFEFIYLFQFSVGGYALKKINQYSYMKKLFF